VKIVTSWDDGSVYDLKVAELLDKHKLTGTFYIPAEWIVYMENVNRNPLTLDQFLEISKKYEIGSHTVTHRHLTKLYIPDARWEIQESKIILEEITGKEITKFCYPRGYNNEAIRRIVEESGYKEARGVKVGSYIESDLAYNQPTTVHVYDGRKEYKGKGWLSYAREMLKMAKSSEQILAEHSGDAQIIYHLWGHSWEIERDNLWDELDEFLGEIA